MRNFAEFFSQASRFFSFDIVEIRREKIGEINQAQKFSSRFSISVFSCLLDRFSRFGQHIGTSSTPKLSLKNYYFKTKCGTLSILFHNMVQFRTIFATTFKKKRPVDITIQGQATDKDWTLHTDL